MSAEWWLHNHKDLEEISGYTQKDTLSELHCLKKNYTNYDLISLPVSSNYKSIIPHGIVSILIIVL